MKHLPNLLTLANLFCGCIAIAYIINAQPFLADVNGVQYWVTGTEQAHWGAVFIALAAVFDMLDGFAARTLKIFSPIGKDLDSLADVVSFGVAPSMILYKMLWASYMGEAGALDVDMMLVSPAFLIACFGAVRLARYNISADTQSSSFTGMPIPAVGLFIATFPILNWFNPYGMGDMLHNKWVLYLVIAILSWLMVSKIRFFKFLPSKFSIANIWPQLIIIVATAGLYPILKYGVLPVAFILYILLSFIYKPKEA
ncbi:MAG: CDP-diacylglycerol--serine O-phosphatidyltransferase [Bacteroidetes bacterium]|nr:CDP-diacylglycerol--serine O-phosphatidyltransferase [Bacteroidota bacterium]